MMAVDTTIYQRPAELLQHLIRFDTTNPPGNEFACVNYVNDLLTDAGIETTILAKDPNRPNLIARLPGRGEAPPLLLYGHVDVVTTAAQDWERDPFGGEIIDGLVWGRGALDMKGGVAMMISAFLKMNAEDIRPPGDVILAVLSDEEAGSNYGAKFLVEGYKEQFDGVLYALGEFGGFNLEIAGKKFYPIQIAEKQVCWMKATVRGPAGHGSRITQGGAMAKLGRMLQQLDENLLPVHVTPVASEMFGQIADAFPIPTRTVIRQILNPALTDRILKLLGERGILFSSIFRNTVNTTIVRGGDKVNVIPSEIEVEMDGRLLPGFGSEDMLREIKAIVGEEIEIQVLRFDPGPAEPKMGMFKVLGDVLVEADPEGIPVPLMIPAVTDARFFSQLGIQTYGYTPVQIPEGMNFFNAVHGANERVPVDAITFGANAIYKVLQRFHG
jgi:acetylornithine deacetylase/succinyl-diaminopimelate desuccinylase-like protein